MDAQQLQKLIKDVERLKQVVGIPDDQWTSPAKALTAMGIDYGPDWLKGKLKQAEYAFHNQLKCPLVKGKHYGYDGRNWSVNATSETKYLLLNAELPEIPVSYAA